MADLTAKRNVTLRRPDGKHAYAAPMLGTTNFGAIYRLWAGDLIISQAADGGFGKPFKNGTTIASGDVFVGLSEESHLIDVADDGKVKATTLQGGWVSFPVGSLTQADIGKVVYATDAETLTLTALNNLPVGILKAVDSHAWVDIVEYAGKAVP